MISKPKLTVDKFNGMFDNGGIYYLDGFSIENENGVSSLDESYVVNEIAHDSTTNFTNINNLMSKKYIYSLPSSTLNAVNGYTLMINDGGLLFTAESFTSSVYSGFVGGLASSGNFAASKKPDLFQLPSGNILVTYKNHLGLIIRGLCKTGSGTTILLDKDGRNFETLGLNTTAPRNQVCNLKTGALYTITSITNGDATKDQLSFSASGALTNTENDEFLAYSLDKWNLNYVDGNSANTTPPNPITVPHFKGQQQEEYWARPIRQYGDQYMIGNGNYIALLNSDETTLDATYKQLPFGYQLLDFQINSSMILVSAVDNLGKGHLLLWDGFSEGWNEILNIETAPKSIFPYNNGWVYLCDGTIYFTNGTVTEKLISWSEKYRNSSYNTTNFNTITALNNNLYFCVGGGQEGTRSIPALLVFNPNTGLSLMKLKSNGKSMMTPYCINVKTEARIDTEYMPSPVIEVVGHKFYNQLLLYRSSTDTKDFKSFVMLIDFGQETKVSEIWLNVKRCSQFFLGNRNLKNTNISVNYGNNQTPIIGFGQVSATSTTKITNANGAIYPGVVGQEIEFIPSFNNAGITDIVGQRSFIQSITSPGTSSEEWVISPALSGSAGETSLRAWGLKNSETKIVTLDKLSAPLRFPVNFIGDKMWLEVTVRGIANSFPVSINNIQIF